MKKYLFFALLLWTFVGQAAIKLPPFIGDNMVLQRDRPSTIWGNAASGEKITVSFINKTFSTIADNKGKWRLQLPPSKAGGPFTMTIKGRNSSVVLKDILVGDVWICAGGASMLLQTKEDSTSREEPAGANYSNIRLFGTRTGKKWIYCDSQSAGSFSGTAFFFARNLHLKLNIPIGMIQSETLDIAEIAELYNVSVKGIIWNDNPLNDFTPKPEILLPQRIQDYRANFKQIDLPFLFVEATDPSARELQKSVLAFKNTDRINAIDLAPNNTREIGRRLAALAKRRVYNLPTFAHGPQFDSFELRGKSVRIHFSNTGTGLKTNDKKNPTNFTIAGSDGHFHPAIAEIIDENTIEVFSPAVTTPAAVRYAWEKHPHGLNLVNSLNLPAYPFKTDNWKN